MSTASTGLNVVVVGATGNVGTSVVAALGDEPAVRSIVGVARRRPEWTPAKTEWVSADVARDDLTGIFRGVEAVISLAWQFQPTHDPATTWESNVIGSARVFDAVAEARVPALIYASSVGAYSPGPKDSAVDEQWPTHGWPEAAYTREKAYLERVLDGFECAHPEVRVVRLRPGFIFKPEAASEQRRLFGGPFVPQRLVRPSLVPVVPDLPGLRFQALHATDVADAYRRAVLGPVHGAFNLAADPVVDSALLAEILDARVMAVPPRAMRAALAALWRLHVVPASPGLFDAVLRLPIMDCSRARDDLGWTPQHTSREAIEGFLTGLRERAGMATPPLAS